jgi:hypothetical protein
MSGNNRVTTPTGGPAETIEYCVKGTTATLREPDDGLASRLSSSKGPL